MCDLFDFECTACGRTVVVHEGIDDHDQPAWWPTRCPQCGSKLEAEDRPLTYMELIQEMPRS